MSSSSSSSGSTLSGLRLSGTSLMSGLDTESIVKAMASGTKSRINKQQQKSDSLTWMQEIYQSIITKISTFQSTYFDTLSPTNLGSNKLMAAFKAESTNSKVTASAASNANPATYTISDIDQLAKNAEIGSDFGGDPLSSGIKLDFSAAAAGKVYNVKLTLDGASKNIAFTGGANAADNFETQVKVAFGNRFSIVDGILQYDDQNDGIAHSFDILASTTNDDNDKTLPTDEQSLNAIGLTASGISNKVTLSTRVGDINFSTPLQGGSYTFTINRKEFTFGKDATVREIINKVNADTTANVTLSFDSLAQKFTLKSDTDGGSSSIEMSQTSGNLLSSMFGSAVIDGGKEIGSDILMKSSITGSALSNTDFEANKAGKIEVTVNGVTKTITLTQYDYNGQKNDFKDITTTDPKTGEKITDPGALRAVAALNIELEAEFGVDAPRFTYDEKTKKITLGTASGGDIVSVGAIDSNAESSALLSKLGFSNGTTNAILPDSKLSDLIGSGFTAGTVTIGTATMAIDSNTTLAEIEDAFGSDNISINYMTGAISAKAQVSAADANGEALVSALFGGDYDDVNTYSGSMATLTGVAETAVGQNAILTVNGTTISSATNTITIDGTTINIGNLTAQPDGSVDLSGGPITVTTTRDASAAKDAVVKFVDAYNTFIDEIYKEVQTKRPTSDGTVNGAKYDPLTEEQREEMSDDEITAWEKKAKTGLLYNDSTVLDFLNKLRTSLSCSTTDGFSLAAMGITTSSNVKENGKLLIDADGKDRFNKAFEENPEKIQELFTDSTRGLAASITKAMDRAVSTSRTDGYGSLVRLAGKANTASASENEISTQIANYQESISELKDRYSDELERYWARFTALETAMAKYNSYSSLFTSSTQ